MPEKIEIINNWNLKKLFDELENGNIKIPRFQRLYVWERAKIVKLLNSIYSQYPIGSFFLWLAGQGFEHFAKEDPELGLPRVPSFGIYQFILDGQQRITSLYVALKGKHLGGVDYSVICFNLTREEFVIPRLKSEQHNIPAWKLFDTHEYAKVYAQYVVEDIAKAEAWGRCQRAFSDYPLSIIKSMNMGLEEVVEIFERINQGGKRLTLFDLVHASTWRDAPRFDIREEIGSFHKLNPNMAVFGTLASEVFTQSLALNVFHDCKNKNQLDLTAEACATHWGKSMECLKLAIDYARGKLGVRTIEFMPYQSMLSIIQHYFYAVGEKTMQPAHDQYIQNWFWTATFSARYSNATLTKMKDDADWIRALAAGNLEERTFPIAISTREIIKIRMNIASAIKNGILCLYALKMPKDFHNGQFVTLDRTSVSRANAKENHHFFPYSLRADFGTDENGINSVVNLAFISQVLNREISNARPSEYIADYALHNPSIHEHLDSHFIDDEAIAAIKEDNFAAFLERRAQVIYDAILQKVQGVGGEESAEAEIDDAGIEYEVPRGDDEMLYA